MGDLDALKRGVAAELLSVLRALPRAPFDAQNRAAVARWFAERDVPFLGRILIGAVCAILVLSEIMSYLLANHFAPTYAFFLGLIALSVVVPAQLVRTWRLSLALPMIVGLALTVYVTVAVNPADKARTKSEHYQQQSVSLGESEADMTSLQAYSPGEYAYGALAGAVAVSAMALPGISGSLVLILMGQYRVVLGAVSELKTLSPGAITFVAVFCIGLGIGLMLFAKLINWVLGRFHDMTMAFLLGLMAGSGWALWPFKATVTADLYMREAGVVQLVRDVVIRTNRNVLPTPSQITLPLVFFLAGCVVMGVFTLRGKPGARA
jgi:putative membrane protein